MAMQSGNGVSAEKMHGGGGGAGTGGTEGRGQQWWHHNQQQQQQQHHQPQQLLQMDERDGFISWLRGEFAAANAMIDALCHHLRLIGEHGEYDGVIGCIQQRRCNWNPVLHMQQYLSVAEVVYALQQAEWRRQHQQQRIFDGSGKLGKEYRRGGGVRGGLRSESFKEGKEVGQQLANGKEMNANAGLNVKGNENLDSVEDRVGKGEGKEKSGDEKKGCRTTF